MKTSLPIRIGIILILIYQVPDTDFETIADLLLKLPILLLDELKYPKKKKK